MDLSKAWFDGWPVTKEGPGRGWWGPPKGTHTGGEKPGTTVGLRNMMPKKNRDELKIPASGITDATSLDGIPISRLAYNPATGTLLAGTDFHTDLIHRHGGGHYDAYVKVNFSPWAKELMIDGVRTTWRDTAEAWDKAYKTAKALHQAGFPGNTKVILKVEGLESWLEQELGEML